MFAAQALLKQGQGEAVQVANPLAFGTRRTHGAGATVMQGRGFLGADRLHAAKLAAERRRIIADACRAQLSLNQLGDLGLQLRLEGFVFLDTLHIKLLVVLAKCHIQGPGESTQRHADLHLGVMQRLRALHALLQQAVEALPVVRLNLQ